MIGILILMLMLNASIYYRLRGVGIISGTAERNDCVSLRILQQYDNLRNGTEECTVIGRKNGTVERNVIGRNGALTYA